MRRLLPALVLATVVLAACGGGESEPTTGTDPTSDEPSMSIGDPVQEPTVVDVISAPAAGGRVTPTPVPVGDPADLRGFVAQFEGDLPRQITRAAADATVPDGQTLLASVVDIGCNPPRDVNVTVADGGVRVVPVATKDTGVRCFAEVTTVALVTAIV